MKKFNLFALLLVAEFVFAYLLAGCSYSTAMGTSEEGNEFADNVSSSSENTSSDSKNYGVKSSCSCGQSSSSITHSYSSSIASVKLTSSSTDSEPVLKSSDSQMVSSSSEKRPGDAMSSSQTLNEGDTKWKSLDYYLSLFELESGSFDKGILSTKIDFNKDGNTQNPNPPMSTEFDTPWPHKIVKQNVDALKEFFPMAFEKYSDIIMAIKNETLDKKCGLYTFNVYSDGLSVAYIVAEIAKDTITVLDVPAGECKALPSSEISRFLFYYCGEIDSHPDVVHVSVESNLSKNQCPVINNRDEWVKKKSPVLSKKNL